MRKRNTVLMGSSCPIKNAKINHNINISFMNKTHVIITGKNIQDDVRVNKCFNAIGISSYSFHKRHINSKSVTYFIYKINA